MSIILFFVSLLLIIALFGVKYFGLSIFTHERIVELVKNNDKKLHVAVGKSREFAKKVHFQNFKKVVKLTADTVKTESIYLKKKFDSKQPKFFLKPVKPGDIDRNKVSFFLKKVSDYKDSLKEKGL